MVILQAWPLLSVASALIVGLALGTLLTPESVMVVVLLIALLALLGAGLSLVKATSWLPAVSLVLLSLAASVGVQFWAHFHPQVRSIETIDGETLTLVSTPVDKNGTSRAYATLADGRKVRAAWASGEAGLYGTQFRVSGTLEPPEVTSAFNEARFLRAHGAVGILKISALERLPSVGGSAVMRMIGTWREELLRRVRRAMAPPADATVAGIVLGNQSALTPQLEEAFRRTGTSHLLVASGSNLVMLAGIAGIVLIGLGRTLRVFIIVGLVLLFVVIAGGESSIIRAAWFVGLLFLGELSGRRVHAPTLIALVALVMALINPWIVLGDIGFQLSFAAVLGLNTFGSSLAKSLPGWFSQDVLAPTLAAHIATLPILVYHFGSASVIAPLANLVAVPFALPIMVGGILSLALPWLRVIAWATEGATTVLLLIITTMGEWSWATLEVPEHNWIWTGASLFLLVALGIWQSLYRTQGVRRG